MAGLSERDKAALLFLPMKTVEEVANHILISNEIQRVVTAAQVGLLSGFEDKEKRSARSTAPTPIKDNLERIRAFKARWNGDLKSLLDKELFSPRGWIDLLSKNEAVADLLRKKGNEYFIRKNFDMALRAYTLSGMYAPKDSKSLALSYSNRSACFAETNNWNKCLEDIKRFEEIWNKIEEVSTTTRDKVVKRKEKCLKEIGGAEEDISIEKKYGNKFFKLKNPRSADLPSLENFLGVKTDPKRGKGIYNISDKVIEPGTFLILDDPYSHVHRPSFCFQTNNCSACYRTLDGSGIPCGGCVFNLYCSEACATSDYHNFHANYECKLAPYLFEVLPNTEFYSNTHLALSILLKLGPQALLDHYRQVFNKGEGQENDKDGSGFASYLPIYNLIYHEGILCQAQTHQRSKYAVVLTEILDFCTDYFTCLNLDKLEANLVKEEFARRLLCHQFCLAANAYPIVYKDLPKERPYALQELGGFDKVLGTGIYPVGSLINHSCAPNAIRFCLPGGVMGVMALEYIVPGQEIFVTYRSLYYVEARKERREGLKKIFGFKCECTACTCNWPVVMYLKSSGSEIDPICPNCRKKLEVLNKIHLEYEPPTELLVCPRKCGFKISSADLITHFNYITGLCNNAMKPVLENKNLKGFMEAKKCVQYFDAHFEKPIKEGAVSAEAITMFAVIIAGKMFD